MPDTKPERITEEEKLEQIKEVIKENLPKIERIIRNYSDLREDYYKLVSVWVMGTYLHKSFPSYPYLFFNAVKSGGKSRILNLIKHLAHKGKFLASLSEAVLFRTAESGYTFCIDEFERVGSKEKANLRELLNAAYKRGVGVERIAKIKTPDGTAFVPEYFEVYTPVIMANIWGLEDVLSDRCITLTLEKSWKPEITRKIELFDTDLDISVVKQSFSAISAVPLLKIKYMMAHWNAYLVSYYNGADGIDGYKGNNGTNGTTILTKEEKTFFDKIIKTSLDSRHLELFFPLFFIASMVGNKVLDELIATAETIVNERRLLDVAENRDILLLQFLNSMDEIKDFVTVRSLVKEFKEFLGEEESSKWINSRWLGRALRRQVLIVDQRHMHSGREVIINFKKIDEKARAFVEPKQEQKKSKYKECRICGLKKPEDIDENGICLLCRENELKVPLEEDEPKSNHDKLYNLIQDFNNKVDLVAVEDVMRAAKENLKIDEPETEDIIERLKREGSIYEPKAGFVRALE